jgi:hypothetical protein
MPEPNPLYQAAGEIFAFFQVQGWRSCLIGGMAVLRWGRPRATQDVDVSLFTDFGNEERFVDTILARFPRRTPDARERALEHRVLLTAASNEVGIDVALAAFPFEDAVIHRASPFQFEPGVVIPTASAEDLIISKAFANRPIDWMDVEGIMIRQKKRLDWGLIESELQLRCDLIEIHEPLEALVRLRAKLRK